MDFDFMFIMKNLIFLKDFHFVKFWIFQTHSVVVCPSIFSCKLSKTKREELVRSPFLTWFWNVKLVSNSSSEIVILFEKRCHFAHLRVVAVCPRGVTIPFRDGGSPISVQWRRRICKERSHGERCHWIPLTSYRLRMIHWNTTAIFGGISRSLSKV